MNDSEILRFIMCYIILFPIISATIKVIFKDNDKEDK